MKYEPMKNNENIGYLLLEEIIHYFHKRGIVLLLYDITLHIYHHLNHGRNYFLSLCLQFIYSTSESPITFVY